MIAGAPLLLYVTLLGLVFGSFFNVVIYRLPRGQSLWWPSSRCPKCGKPVRALDNVPVVSWLLLGGRCRDCGNPISIQYPIVETMTAAVFLLIAWMTPPGPELASRLVLASALIVLFAIDLELQILPNAITLPGIVVGFAFSFFTPIGWQNSLIGIALGGGLLYLIAGAYYLWRRQEGMGMGDVKMLAMIGAFLGWQAVIVTLILSSFAGAIVGLGLMVAQRGDMKVALPFGTFLALGALAAMLFGDALVAWYAGFYQL
jgi:leader peptidase (prepilin peptidase)/N-methyltransferase